MDVPKAECGLLCPDGSGPKYTRTLQTEASVSKNFLSWGGGFTCSYCAGAGAHKSPGLCCSASKQEESSENLPGQLETSWVTMLQKSHLKINRRTIKDTNGLPGWSQKEAWLSSCIHCSSSGAVAAPSCFPAPLLSCKTQGVSRAGYPIASWVSQNLCHKQGGDTRARTPLYQHHQPVFSFPSIVLLRVTVGATWHGDM